MRHHFLATASLRHAHSFSRKRSGKTSFAGKVGYPLATIGLPIRLLIGTLAVSLLATVVWSFCYRIPEFATAEGVFIAPGSVKGIATTEGGRIKEIRVHVGQSVQKGDLIAVIQAEKLDLEIAKLQAELDSLTAADKEIIRKLEASYSARISALQGQFELCQKRIPELEENVANLRRTLAKQVASTKTANAEMESLSSAQLQRSRTVQQLIEEANHEFQEKTSSSNDSGFPLISKIEQIERGRGLFQDASQHLNIMISQLELNSRQVENQIRLEQLTSEIAKLINQSSDIAAELLQVELDLVKETSARQLKQLEKQLLLKALLDRKEIVSKLRAPHDGNILSLDKLAGDTIAPGERIGFLIDAGFAMRI